MVGDPKMLFRVGSRRCCEREPSAGAVGKRPRLKAVVPPLRRAVNSARPASCSVFTALFRKYVRPKFAYLDLRRPETT